MCIERCSHPSSSPARKRPNTDGKQLVLFWLGIRAIHWAVGLCVMVFSLPAILTRMYDVLVLFFCYLMFMCV